MIEKIKSLCLIINDYHYDSGTNTWSYGHLATVRFTWDIGTKCWVPDPHQYYVQHLFGTLLDLIDYLNEEYACEDNELIIIDDRQVCLAMYSGSKYSEKIYRDTVDKWKFYTEEMLRYFVTELYLGGIHIM